MKILCNKLEKEAIIIFFMNDNKDDLLILIQCSGIHAQIAETTK